MRGGDAAMVQWDDVNMFGPCPKMGKMWEKWRTSGNLWTIVGGALEYAF